MPEKAANPIPEGMLNVTAHLWFNGNCNQAIELYQKAFGAELAAPAVPTPDGKGVLHALLKLGDSRLMMADAWPGNFEQGPQDSTTVGLFLYVEDCDAVFKRATEAGLETVAEMADMFWGDRMGKVRDTFGHTWAIATFKWAMTPEEIQKGQAEWLASMKQD